MDKAYKKIVEKSYCIKKVEYGFSFITSDDRPCELTIVPELEIHKGKALLSASYELKISNYSYTYGN